MVEIRWSCSSCAGCAFIKYSQRDQAQAAINALNGVFSMDVRFWLSSSGYFASSLFSAEQIVVVKVSRKPDLENWTNSNWKPFFQVECHCRYHIWVSYLLMYKLDVSWVMMNQMWILLFFRLNYLRWLFADLFWVVQGCDQPLAVRFADPKRPKGGDARYVLIQDIIVCNALKHCGHSSLAWYPKFWLVLWSDHG